MNEKLPHRKGTKKWIHCINTLFCHDLVEDDTYNGYRITASPFEGYYVSGTLINNLFHGDVEIYNPNGHMIAQVEFNDGIANGYCSLNDAYGGLFFRGVVRDGFIYRGEVYNIEGEISLVGAFSRGNLIGELIYDSTSKLYEERNIDGDIVAIYAVDRTFYRDGICYRYTKNMITDICIYSKESEIRILKTFSEGAMTEMGKSGVIIYKGGYADSFEEGYAREGNGTQYDATGIHITYQGQFWQNERFGMGSSFKNGNSEPSYEGLWCFNLPYNRFRNIMIWILVIAIIVDVAMFICSGWILGLIFLVLFALIAMISYIQIRKTLLRFPLPLNNEIGSIIKRPFDLAFINPFTTRLKVAENSCNSLQYANLSDFNQLRVLTVSNGSLKKLINFELKYLRQIESVSVGNDCCNADLNQKTAKIVHKFDISNCCSLKSISIMNSCFANYTVMHLSSLSSLQTISIGNYCFKWVSELKIEHLPSLTSITVGSNCFENTKKVRISNNAALQTVYLGNDSFSSVSELIIEHLPSLTSISIGSYCFGNTKRLSISDSPSLLTINIEKYSFKSALELLITKLTSLSQITIGSNCFGNTSSVHIHDNPALRTITMGNDSFGSVSELIIEHLTSLTSISIGSDCFGNTKKLSIADSPALQKIDMGNNCFKSVSELLLANLTSLFSITTGSNCFGNTNRVQITEDPVLRMITINSNCFKSVSELIIEHLPSLTSINIGTDCFGNTRKLSIADNPALQMITINSNCFKSVSELVIEHLTSLTSVTIGSNCFTYTRIARITDNPSLVSISISDGCFSTVSGFTIKLNAILTSIKIEDSCFTHSQSFSVTRNHCSSE